MDLIKSQNWFEEAMEESTDIKDYIFKILMDGELGENVEVVEFSELYNIQMQIYDSSVPQLLLVEIIPQEGIIFTNLKLIKTIPSTLTKNVNHINKIIMTKL